MFYGPTRTAFALKDGAFHAKMASTQVCYTASTNAVHREIVLWMPSELAGNPSPSRVMWNLLSDAVDLG